MRKPKSISEINERMQELEELEWMNCEQESEYLDLEYQLEEMLTCIKS